ncbi:DUF4275 family protein [Tahibacter caeni]|uniref:DUF4275 family protein n=1 Tax=Tahibacter caeni TaxID=1453545 RepID=UPI0021487765|nr:DUF4275 family protein [Tahibacter caeni]
MKSRKPSIIVAPGSIIREYTRNEAAHWMAQWLIAFGRRRGDVSVEPYLWHVFSFGCHLSVALDAARAEYGEAVAASHVVMTGEGDAAVATDERPTQCDRDEYLVFPPNLAWTMAFTHEDGWLGPFFARHHDYDRLNAENLAAIAKRQEAERARRDGWA